MVLPSVEKGNINPAVYRVTYRPDGSEIRIQPVTRYVCMYVYRVAYRLVGSEVHIQPVTRYICVYVCLFICMYVCMYEGLHMDMMGVTYIYSQ